MSGRHDADELAAAYDALEGRFTELVAAVRGLTLNGVLAVELVIIPTTGRVTVDKSVPFAAVAIDNHTAAAVTVDAAPERETAPAAGVGVVLVDANKKKVTALTGDVLTIYGTPGGSVDLQIFTTPQPPSFG